MTKSFKSVEKTHSKFVAIYYFITETYIFFNPFLKNIEKWVPGIKKKDPEKFF